MPQKLNFPLSPPRLRLGTARFNAPAVIFCDPRLEHISGIHDYLLLAVMLRSLVSLYI